MRQENRLSPNAHLGKGLQQNLAVAAKKLLGGRRILSGLQRTGIASRCIRDRLHLHLELLSPEGLQEPEELHVGLIRPLPGCVSLKQRWTTNLSFFRDEQAKMKETMLQQKIK